MVAQRVSGGQARMLEVPVRIVLHPEALHERARERAFAGTVNATISRSPSASKPRRMQARAASVA